MLMTATAEVVREMFRRADARLARSAARNAAESVGARNQRIMEEARTMRDLHRLEVARGAQARP